MKLPLFLNSRGRMRIKLNVQYQVKDASGKIKRQFNANGLGLWLMKHGFIDPREIAKFSFLGSYANTMNVSNLVTTAGKALVAGRLNGSGAPAAADYIAVGTGTTAAAVANTTLETESASAGLSRAQGTVSLVTTDTTNDTAQVTKTFSVTGTVAVTESGVLNAASSGTLLARQVFAAINVVNGDSLAITWKFDVD